MADLAAVVGFRLVLVDVQLGTAAMADDLDRNLGLGGVLADLDVVATDQQDRELDFGTGVRVQLLHLEDIALGNAVLLAARLHDCEHLSTSRAFRPEAALNTLL